MTHLDILNTSYGKNKGRDSNWQFESRPQKVRNRPNPFAFRSRANHHWKALDKSYKFASNLILIEGLSTELQSCKVARVQTLAVLGLPLGSPGTKIHSDVSLAKRRREYYMGEGGGFPRVQAMVNLVSQRSPVVHPSTKGAPTMY